MTTNTKQHVKITGLTPMNISALREVLGDDAPVTITPTTATFTGEHPLAFMGDVINAAAAKHGRKGHPTASLHAVYRKLDTAVRKANAAAAGTTLPDPAAPVPVGDATPGHQSSNVRIAVALIRRALQVDSYAHLLSCYGRTEDDVIVVAARFRDTGSRLALDAAQSKLESLGLDIDRINPHSLAVIGVR